MLKVYARLRFGRSDLGVNNARINQWIGAMDLPPSVTDPASLASDG
ncbi:hypothetical protein [Phaeobacter sp.]|nr:hypothetical protein [Phaeobacter sp.]